MTPRPTATFWGVWPQQRGGIKVTWAGVLIPCPIGPAQQAVDMAPLADLNNYDKNHTAILQMLNLSPEVYRRRLREIDFGPDYQPRTIGQQIRAVGLRWLRPEARTKEQVVDKSSCWSSTSQLSCHLNPRTGSYMPPTRHS